MIDRRTTRMLDAGSVDDQIFFCALLAGAPAKFAQAREDVRMGDFGRAMQDASVAVDAVHHLQLIAETGASGRLPLGNIVAALVGPLARTRHMDVAALNLPSAVAALSFAWTSIRSDWRHLDEVVVRTADTLTIADPSAKPVPAIMDGEQVAIGSRFIVRYNEGAARRIVAAS